MADPLAKLTAPTLQDIERLADEAFAALPEEFKQLAGQCIVQVDDFPDADTLRDMECETEFDLLGLFIGIGQAQAQAMPETGQLPNKLWLYRRPILDYWAEHEETLGHLVAHVLIHEIGHHFGLSDEDMEEIEKSVA